MKRIDGFTDAGATISPCERYRFLLWRTWGSDASNRACWIMLNPSTADAEKLDPTLRRCVGFSRAWGYHGLDVVNLYAFRATDPRELWKEGGRHGPGNLMTILDAAKRARLVVAAWGSHGDRDGIGIQTADLLLAGEIDLQALKVTKSGQPSHPLYLPGSLRPVPYRPDASGVNPGAKPAPFVQELIGDLARVEKWGGREG